MNPNGSAQIQTTPVLTCTLSEAKYLYPGDSVSFYENDAGETVICVKSSNKKIVDMATSSYAEDGGNSSQAENDVPLAISLPREQQIAENEIEKARARYDKTWVLSDGCSKVEKEVDGVIKYGFIDEQGKEIIPPIYKRARFFHEGFAAVRKFENPEKIVFINKKGEELDQPIYDAVREFSNGFMAVRKGMKWGFIDKDRKEITEIIFDEVEDFSNGYAKVKLDTKPRSIDTTGKILDDSSSSAQAQTPASAPKEPKDTIDPLTIKHSKYEISKTATASVTVPFKSSTLNDATTELDGAVYDVYFIIDKENPVDPKHCIVIDPAKPYEFGMAEITYKRGWVKTTPTDLSIEIIEIINLNKKTKLEQETAIKNALDSLK